MDSGKILVAQSDGAWVVKFAGDIRMPLCTTIEGCLNDMFRDASFQSVVIDLTETHGIDSTSLGLLAKISLKTQDRINDVPTLVSTNDDVTRVLLSMGFKDKVFVISSEPLGSTLNYAEVEELPCSEIKARDKVIEAHRILMDLNESNHEKFQDLVEALEGPAAVASN